MRNRKGIGLVVLTAILLLSCLLYTSMQYAIELYYDKETEQKLFNLAKRVADEKLSTKFLEWKTRPHLTLACFNDVNETKCIQRLRCV